MINTNRLVALGCWIMLATLQGCSSESDKSDVGFAKTLLFSMVNGSAVESAIDWETFKTDEQDIGAVYKALPNDTEKASFRKEFLSGFARSTPNIKANPGGISNWRVKSESPAETVVAADMNGGAVMLLTVSKRDGKQQLSAMRIEKK
jgi:hypothetical protein